MKTALLVDFDNLWVGLQNTSKQPATPKSLAMALRRFAEGLGPIAVAQVYTSVARRVKGMEATFTSAGFEVFVAPRPHRSADVLMASNGLKILYTQPEIGSYVLASGDSDFLPLAQNVVERGARLIVVAPKLVASIDLVAIADPFVPVEQLLGAADVQIGSPKSEDLGKTALALQRSSGRTRRLPNDRMEPQRPVSGPAPKPTQKVRTFLCHSHQDQAKVRELYTRLKSEPGVQPWLDKEDLLGGQDWELEIAKQVKESHCVLVCLSKQSVERAGFAQKEIRLALDTAERQPEGRIFLIPVKLEPCDLPERLARFHAVSLFEEGGYGQLVKALYARGDAL